MILRRRERSSATFSDFRVRTPEPSRGDHEPAGQDDCVLIVRATKKLRQRLGSATQHAGEQSTTLLAEWYATALLWRPQQLIMLVN
jgi:hypothetical protein